LEVCYVSKYEGSFGSWCSFWTLKRRWNPKMAPYLYGVRNNIHIIDLGKTVLYLEEAYNFVSDAVSKGAEVLF